MPEGISVIAGNGILPKKILEKMRRKGIYADVVGISSECSSGIRDLARRYVEIDFYDIERGILELKRFGNREVVFIGGLSKLNMLKQIMPSVLIHTFGLKGMSDEEIFKGIIRRLEEEGFKVKGISEYYEEGIVKGGLICGERPEERYFDDAIYGIKFIKHNSDFSIGQSVIIRGQNILAVEGAAGTDYMIKTMRGTKISDAVFIKCSKRGQDERIDLPSIGKKTIDLLKRFGINYIFLESGKTIIIGDEETIRYAGIKGLTIWGMESG